MAFVRGGYIRFNSCSDFSLLSFRRVDLLVALIDIRVNVVVLPTVQDKVGGAITYMVAGKVTDDLSLRQMPSLWPCQPGLLRSPAERSEAGVKK